MGVQEIIVTGLFILAVFYIGRMLYKSLNTKKGCGQNCKCGVDFSDIQIPDREKSR